MLVFLLLMVARKCKHSIELTNSFPEAHSYLVDLNTIICINSSLPYLSIVFEKSCKITARFAFYLDGSDEKVYKLFNFSNDKYAGYNFGNQSSSVEIIPRSEGFVNFSFFAFPSSCQFRHISTDLEDRFGWLPSYSSRSGNPRKICFWHLTPRNLEIEIPFKDELSSISACSSENQCQQINNSKESNYVFPLPNPGYMILNLHANDFGQKFAIIVTSDGNRYGLISSRLQISPNLIYLNTIRPTIESILQKDRLRPKYIDTEQLQRENRNLINQSISNPRKTRPEVEFKNEIDEKIEEGYLEKEKEMLNQRKNANIEEIDNARRTGSMIKFNQENQNDENAKEVHHPKNSKNIEESLKDIYNPRRTKTMVGKSNISPPSSDLQLADDMPKGNDVQEFEIRDEMEVPVINENDIYKRNQIMKKYMKPKPTYQYDEYMKAQIEKVRARREYERQMREHTEKRREREEDIIIIFEIVLLVVVITMVVILTYHLASSMCKNDPQQIIIKQTYQEQESALLSQNTGMAYPLPMIFQPGYVPPYATMETTHEQRYNQSGQPPVTDYP